MAEYGVENRFRFINLAVDIVAAYVANNSLPAAELPALIAKVYAGVASVINADSLTTAPPALDIEKPTPAQIRRSVRDDGILSFIDGKSYKTLKRHLSANGLDPRGYRERYGLPAEYPIVAPNYAALRSALAKQSGLGMPGARVAQRKTGTGR